MGSSVLVLEQEDSPDMREGGGVSPMPSQLTQQTQFTRQRPRFHTVQDLDMALNQAIEGKINSKNAWASKEASNLLEGITHTIESTLEAHTSDDYSGFAKAATVVEGCSKVWTVRVDSTYNRSNQMVQRLLRNDNDDDGGGAAEGGGDGSDGMSREAADGLGISSWGEQEEEDTAAVRAAVVRRLLVRWWRRRVRSTWMPRRVRVCARSV